MLLIRCFCRGGGIGRHAGLRNQCLRASGFESLLRHKMLTHLRNIIFLIVLFNFIVVLNLTLHDYDILDVVLSP